MSAPGRQSACLGHGERGETLLWGDGSPGRLVQKVNCFRMVRTAAGIIAGMQHCTIAHIGEEMRSVAHTTVHVTASEVCAWSTVVRVHGGHCE